MTDEIKALQDELLGVKNELSGVYQHNAALQEEIEKLTSGKQSNGNGQPYQTVTFTLDGEQYGFNFSATNFKGNKISHVEIAADEALQRELIKIGAGILKKLI